MRYVILVFILSLVSGSYSSNKIVETTNDSKPKRSHLYFLSIGNAHYSKDALAGIETFLNVPGANLSAEYVADAFRCFGEGATLFSNQYQLLSKKLILQSIDSVIRVGCKDSLSTTIIYYCGHGFSDNDGNLYLVPGNHVFNNTSASLESLISIDQIQQKINDAIKREYPKDSLLSNQPEIKKAFSQYEATLSKIEDEDNVPDMVKLSQNYLDVVRRYKSKLNRPKFLVIADCCTENAAEVNYSGFINKANFTDKPKDIQMDDIDWKEFYKLYGVDSLDELTIDTASVKEALGSMNEIFKNKLIPQLTPLMYSSSVMGTKSEAWVNGHRTIYSAEVGKLVPMVQSLFDREDLIGPTARRICLYFNKSKNAFTLADLLTKLMDGKFDKLTKSPRIEDAFSSTMSFDPKKAFGGMDYSVKMNRNNYLTKKDSSLFLCK